MTLMQVGYFIFINKVERGFEAVDSPHLLVAENLALVPPTFGSLAKPGRELLVGAWDGSKVARLVSLVSEVRGSPVSVRVDLASYYETLLDFADRYQSVKRRAPKELAKVHRRSNWVYRYERKEKLKEAERSGESDLRIAEAKVA
jgi:hypothetical protein